MAPMGTLLSVGKGGFRESEMQCPVSGDEFRKATVSCVPFADGGGSRERPFARSAKNWGAAIRYALVIFLP